MDKIYDSLTSSAREALEDIIEEYRVNLLDEAYMSSNKDSRYNEITVKDLYYAKEIIEKNSGNDIKRYHTNRKKRFSYVLGLTGIAYTMAGFLYFIIKNSAFDIERDMGIIVSVFGLFITFFSYLYFQYNTQKEKELDSENNSYIDDFTVVRLWTQIERKTRNLMRLDHAEPEGDNVSSVISYLNQIFKNEVDYVKLKEILQIRNEITHGEAKLSKTKIEEVVATENMFIEKLDYFLSKKKRDSIMYSKTTRFNMK